MNSPPVSKLFISLRRLGVGSTVSNSTRYVTRSVRTWWHRRNRRRYLEYVGTTDADPAKVIWVDPDEIQYETYTYHGDSLNRYGRVYDGSWDRVRSRFDDRIEFQSLRRHFCEGVRGRIQRTTFMRDPA